MAASAHASSKPRDAAVLARGAFFNFLAFLASNLRGIFTFLVARLLGSAALGSYGMAWATTDLVSKLGTLGLDTGAIGFVARAEAAGDRPASRRIMRSSLLLALGASAALAVLGFWAAWTIGPRLGWRPELSKAAAVMLLALPGIALYRISNALSRGMTVMHHDIYSRGLTESLGTAAALLLVVALGFRRFAPELAVIAGTLASGLVAFRFASPLFGPSRPTPGAGGTPAAWRSRAALLRASAPIALYDLLNIGIMQIDVLMLGLFVGRVSGVTLETLGIYAASVQIAGGLRKVSQSFTPIFVPVVARQIGSGQLREAEATYGYLARWMLVLLLPAIAVLALSGGAILSIFGPAFRVGRVWVAIVGCACALNSFVLLGETILMVERPHVNLFNSTIALAAAIGLNLWLIPRFGPLGAALGMLAPYGLQGLLRGIEISWLFDWHWPWRALAKPWASALGALPLALLARLLLPGLAGEVAAGLLYLGGYLAVWWVIGLDPNDRAVLAELFPKSAAAFPAVVPP